MDFTDVLGILSLVILLTPIALDMFNEFIC